MDFGAARFELRIQWLMQAHLAVVLSLIDDGIARTADRNDWNVGHQLLHPGTARVS